MKGAIPRLTKYSRPTLAVLIKAVNSLPTNWKRTMVIRTMALLSEEIRDEIAAHFGYHIGDTEIARRVANGPMK